MGKFQIFLAIFLLFITYPASAQTQQQQLCTPGNKASGLVSSGTTVSNFGNEQGICAVGSNVAFVSYKIPSYDDLKSIYYDQAKEGTNLHKQLKDQKDQSDIKTSNLDFKQDTIIYIKDKNLEVNGSPFGNKIGIIFVDGSLTFSSDYDYANNQEAGTVFVVKGDVNIYSNVNKINAVIISSGTICTSNNVSTDLCPSGIASQGSALEINGSLIALNPEKKIRFRRNLIDNTKAAEKVNHQAKYLVILRDLFASPLQKWSEIQ